MPRRGRRPARPGRRSCDPSVRVRLRHGVVRRDIRVAVRRLARRLLPARPAPAGLARALRPRLLDRRGEQRLLPAARALGLRALAAADARGLRRGREGEPVPHARPPPPGPARAGRATRRPGRGARRPARPVPPPAPADPARRTRATRRLPRRLPDRRPRRGRAPPRVLVDRRGAHRARAPRRRAVLGRPPWPSGGPPVAHGSVGLRPPARGHGLAAADLRAHGARVVARPHRRRVAGRPVERTCSSTSTTITARQPSATPARCRRMARNARRSGGRRGLSVRRPD